MWIIIKVFTEFCCNLASVVYILVVWHEACGILASQGSNLQSPVLKDEVLTTGLPRESLNYFLESVGLCLLPNLGSFQPLFLQIPFPVYSVLSPCLPRILMIWMLSLLLDSQEFLSLYFFFSSFLFVFHTEQILLIIPQVPLFTPLSSPLPWSLSPKFIAPFITFFSSIIYI